MKSIAVKTTCQHCFKARPTHMVDDIQACADCAKTLAGAFQTGAVGLTNAPTFLGFTWRAMTQDEKELENYQISEARAHRRRTFVRL